MRRLFSRRPKASTTGDGTVSQPDAPPKTDPSSSSSLSSTQSFPSGLKEWYRSENSVVDIVFIHGLTGDRERTWTAQNASSPWPGTLLPAVIPDARILTFGYDAYVADWRGEVSQNRIKDHAWKLLTALSNWRGSDDTHERPIVFVCHSLGGLVCEDALVTSRERPEMDYRNVLCSTRGILFLGTPHHGSDLAKWTQWLASSLSVVKRTNTEIVRVLRRDSEVLARIQESFHTMIMARASEGLEPFEIICFFEELPMPGIGHVVSPDSARIPGYIPIGIHRTHPEMTKVDGVHDPAFIDICGALRRCMKERPGPLRPVDMPAATYEAQREARVAGSRRETRSSERSLNETEKSCMELFSRFDIADYRNALPEPVAGTCRWILAHPQFSSWLDQTTNTLLWLTGHSGCGKTVLSSFLAKHLEDAQATHSRTVVCAYFCDDKISVQRDALSILKSLIYQIVRRHRSLVRHVKKVFEIQGSSLSQSFDSLWNIFLAVASDAKSGSVYIIVDAIDECGEAGRGYFLKAIKHFLQRDTTSGISNNGVKFLITSRPTLSYSQDSYWSLANQLAIDQGQGGYSDDIRRVIHHKVTEIVERRGCSSAMKGFLEQTLYSKADRTFLWVHIILQSLEKSLLASQREFESIIARLPNDLESTYRSFLDGIPPENQSQVSKLIHLIIGSSQYLTLEEINLAFAISPADKTAEVVKSNCSPTMEITLQGFLGPLVRISDSKVSLVHQSAKEFFIQLGHQTGDPYSRLYGVNEVAAAKTIASSCISYLLLEDFASDWFSYESSPVNSSDSSSGLTDGPLVPEIFMAFDPLSLEDGLWFADDQVLAEDTCHSMAGRHGFYSYSALHWAEHYSSCHEPAASGLRDNVLRLLDTKSPHCTNWLTYYQVNSNSDHEIPSLADFDSVSLAAYFNLYIILAEVLERDGSYPQSGKDRALYQSSRRGFRESIRVLLTAGADPNAQVLDIKTPLIGAVQNGHLDSVKLLLADPRTDINLAPRSGRAALSFACGNGHLDIAQALLNSQESLPNQSDNSGLTPLLRAAGGGHDNIVKMLLRYPVVDVNHRDKMGRTALSWAAGDGATKTIKQLLKVGNVNRSLRDKNGRSPLSWAAGNGQDKAVRVLLFKADSAAESEVDKDGRGPVSWACGQGRADALQALIDGGYGGVDDVDVDGWSPLAWAIQKNEPRTVEKLIGTGMVDIERKDHGGRTALSWAVEYGHLSVVRVLVRAGAQIWSENAMGNTPLSKAKVYGRDDILDELLSHEHSVTREDRKDIKDVGNSPS